MEVATILPQQYLSLIRQEKYHMCLANLIEAPGMETYTEFYMNQGFNRTSYLIMDNGLIEGNPRPIEELIHKAQYLHADEFILPDVFRNSKATLEAIQGAYELGKSSGIKMMAVPQGNTLDEWLDCASEIIGNFREIKVLGIPKVLVDIAGRDGRLLAIRKLEEKSPMLRHKEIHLLGCWQTPLELLFIDKAQRSGLIPKVRGVDSAIPYVFARAGVRLDSDDRPDSNPIDFRNGTIQNKALLKRNISIWKKAGDSRSFKEKVYDKLFS